MIENDIQRIPQNYHSLESWMRSCFILYLEYLKNIVLIKFLLQCAIFADTVTHKYKDFGIRFYKKHSLKLFKKF